MTPTFVIVPVLNEWQLTQALLRSLHGDESITDVMILDNGSTDMTAKAVRSFQHRSGYWRGRLHRSDLPGESIYALWNHGFARAKRLARGGEFNCLVANNDVELPREAIKDMAYWLRAAGRRRAFAVYPDYDETNWDFDHTDQTTRETHGVFGDGGLFGPCFMLAGDRIPWAPLITDTAYHWWYGDNHLAECIALAGGEQHRIVGLPVKHVNEGTARHYPELWAKKLHDRGSWVTRHQRGHGVAP